MDFLKKRGIAVKTIIDCGANVGYTSLYFSCHLQEVNIVSIEADKNNAITMFENVKANSNVCIKPMHKLICKGMLFWR